MTYYWDNRISKEQLQKLLQLGYELYDCQDEVSDIEGTAAMRKSYPTYQARRFKVFQNGYCIGYVDDPT